MCSRAIDQVYFNNIMRDQGYNQDEVEQAQNQLRTILINIETTCLENTRRESNIINILRGPQGRLFLDIQVISNFFEMVEELRTNDERQNGVTVLALRNLFVFFGRPPAQLTPITPPNNLFVLFGVLYTSK